MMNRIKNILLLLLTVGSSVALCQQTAVEIEMKGGKAQNVYAVADTSGNLAYVFQGSKSIQVSILDGSCKVINEFLIKRAETEKKNEVIGASLSAQNLVVYLYDAKERNFASVVMNRFTGVYKFNPSIGKLSKTDHVLKSFEMEGVFYAVVVPQFKNSIVLYSAIEGDTFEIKNYEVNFPTLYAKLSSNNEALNQKTTSPIGIEKINYDIENTVMSSHSTKKMYAFDNKIYMTFEEPSHTHIVVIDPKSNAALYRKLNFSLDKDKEGKDIAATQGNSFLYKGDLFRATFNSNQLNLIVIDLTTMASLKNYNIFPDQKISFINGVIREEGGGFQDKIVKNEQAYFRKINKGELAISVNDLNNGQYLVDLGAYEEVTTYASPTPSFGGFPISSGLSIGISMGGGIGIGAGGGGGMGYGGMGGYSGASPNSAGASTTSITTTYFQSLLSVEDLSPIEGNVPKTIREKVNEYEEGILKNNNPALLTILPIYNGLILGYYAKGKTKYSLVSFKR